VIDGAINYETYTLSALEDASRSIDRVRYPINAGNLEHHLQLRRRGREPSTVPTPTPTTVSSTAFGRRIRSLPKWQRVAIGILGIALYIMVGVIGGLLIVPPGHDPFAPEHVVSGLEHLAVITIAVLPVYAGYHWFQVRRTKP
jgi:hypothetical protein